MDEFAQTRGVDDLFDDDIVPVTATAEEVVEETATFEFDPERAWETHPHPQLESQSQSPQTESQAQSQSQSQQKSRGKGLSASVYADAPDDGSTVVVGEYRKRGGGRGRGRGRGRRGRGGRNSGGDNIVRVEGDEQEGVQKGTETENGEQQQEEAEQAKSPDAADQGTDAAAGAVEADDTSNNKSNEEKQEKVYAVRGDRSGTGGVRKPKLTEDELTARITAAKRAAAKRAEAHARAEADEALFRERERVAQEKAKQEAENRRVLANEREANRMRKLKAQGGREWDAEKGEESGRGAFGEGRRGGRYRRGMYGGVGGDVSRNEWNENAGADGWGGADEWDSGRGNGGFRGRGRGRGGRGRGRGRGGRGYEDRSKTDNGWGADITEDTPAPFNAADTDFPALPGANNNASESESAKQSMPSLNFGTPTELKGGTWADQMEPDDPLLANQQ